MPVPFSGEVAMRVSDARMPGMRPLFFFTLFTCKQPSDMNLPDGALCKAPGKIQQNTVQSSQMQGVHSWEPPAPHLDVIRHRGRHLRACTQGHLHAGPVEAILEGGGGCGGVGQRLGIIARQAHRREGTAVAWKKQIQVSLISCRVNVI